MLICNSRIVTREVSVTLFLEKTPKTEGRNKTMRTVDDRIDPVASRDEMIGYHHYDGTELSYLIEGIKDLWQALKKFFRR